MDPEAVGGFALDAQQSTIPALQSPTVHKFNIAIAYIAQLPIAQHRAERLGVGRGLLANTAPGGLVLDAVYSPTPRRAVGVGRDLLDYAIAGHSPHPGIPASHIDRSAMREQVVGGPTVGATPT